METRTQSEPKYSLKQITIDYLKKDNFQSFKRSFEGLKSDRLLKDIMEYILENLKDLKYYKYLMDILITRKSNDPSGLAYFLFEQFYKSYVDSEIVQETPEKLEYFKKVWSLISVQPTQSDFKNFLKKHVGIDTFDIDNFSKNGGQYIFFPNILLSLINHYFKTEIKEKESALVTKRKLLKFTKLSPSVLKKYIIYIYDKGYLKHNGNFNYFVVRYLVNQRGAPMDKFWFFFNNLFSSNKQVQKKKLSLIKQLEQQNSNLLNASYKQLLNNLKIKIKKENPQVQS